MSRSRAHSRWLLLFAPSSRWLAVAVLSLFFLRPVSAQNFDRANALYEKGDYNGAIAEYQKVFEAGKGSAALLFNLGNACFKAGQLGRAIFHYRLAELLEPRDPDIHANLMFARESIAGSIRRHEPRWLQMLRNLTLDEISVLAGLAWWSLFSLLGAGQVRPDWKPALRFYVTIATLSSILFVSWLGFAIQDKVATREAIVIVKEAVVRYGPLEDSQSFFTVTDGVELPILDHKDDWLQISDRGNRTGWIHQKSVLLFKPYAMTPTPNPNLNHTPPPPTPNPTSPPIPHALSSIH